MQPAVKEFFDRATWTLTYITYDPKTKDAVVIDPVWDYDPASSKLTSASADQLLQFVRANDLRVRAILETHAHADHISSSQILKKFWPEAKLAIGERINEVQKVFQSVFDLDASFKTDGSQFDMLMREGQDVSFGSLTVKSLSTPGHTPACLTYVIGDAVFTGDALFMPDYGTGRCDFPAGSARELYHSVAKKIYSLPDHYRVFVGHDYLPEGRPLAFETTIGEEKRKNIHLNIETSEADFVKMREARDKTLAAPRLLLPSVQVNIMAGHLPKAGNGNFLKIPIRS